MPVSQVADTKQFAPPKDSRLSDQYNRWFEIMPATTPTLREEAYRLRYQVYCCEHGYETPAEHPHEMEMDAFDSRSIHSLVVERASGVTTGTVRLILPDPTSPKVSFPIQKICSHPLPEHACMTTAAEISRFAISKKGRKAAADSCPKEIKCLVVLGLMRAIVQMSAGNCITDWFAVMEPSLLRLLSRFSIYFDPVGPLVEHHGVRQPCHANVNALLGRLQQEQYDLWEYLIESSDSLSDEASAVGFSRQ